MGRCVMCVICECVCVPTAEKELLVTVGVAGKQPNKGKKTYASKLTQLTFNRCCYSLFI